MLGLPSKTEVNRKVPKQRFYDHMELPVAVRRMFIDQVDSIYWRNKIAADTINIAKGKDVVEIEVFEVTVTNKETNEKLLSVIDKALPYHVLFVLTLGDAMQVWMSYKEPSEGTNAFKVNRYFHTGWIHKDSITINLHGLDMDAVYGNLVRQVAGGHRNGWETLSLKESVDRFEQKQKLMYDIEKLQQKINTEKQINRQLEMMSTLKEMKRQLEEIQLWIK